MSRAEAVLARGRAMAEGLMVDSCTITRVRKDAHGEPVETTVNGVVTVERDEVYTGKAKRQTYEGYEQNPTVGGQTLTIQRYSAHFPVGSFKPQIGDDIEWTACPMDADRVGTHDRITALFNKSLTTAMRVFVDEEVAP